MKPIGSLLYHLPVYENTMAASFRLSVVVPVYNERHVVEASLRRVLALDHPLISSLEIIIVDDCSTDGSWEILRRLAREDDRIILLRHERNQGKGAAVRTAIARATGDITIIHDADLEYNPADIPALLVPFAKEGADAVFGSRYLSAPYRRALMHRHTMINSTLTFLSNWLTDLNLTDLETCYKAVNTTLLKSIPLRSNDFRFEVEIVFKLAKRRARVFEAPIRYLPRTQEEGKKIRARDGLLALLAMLRFWLIDDMYKKDEYGSRMLVELERTRRFNLWLGRTLRPYIGDKVLELGAGVGTLTSQFIPRELYVAADTNPHYLHYLRSYSYGKPYLRVVKADADSAEDFEVLEGQFDTAVAVNVLEHAADDVEALRNLRSTLEPGGRLIIMVPQSPSLYGSLDAALERRERYSAAKLTQQLAAAGFRVEKMFDFNRASVPGWWLNGKLLGRKKFSRVQLKALDMATPLLRRIDRFLPWRGLSIIAVATRE
ncbi:MAG TPA: glycosyltransferase [Blastocatellia bacterium]|nr:glycosyltransferase [Blastocatellia bacterium]